jgi:hypothetical protein
MPLCWHLFTINQKGQLERRRQCQGNFRDALINGLSDPRSCLKPISPPGTQPSPDGPPRVLRSTVIASVQRLAAHGYFEIRRGWGRGLSNLYIPARPAPTLVDEI